MQGTFLLNIIVTQRTTVLQLLAGKNETLLIRRNALLVLNLGLDVFNGIRGLDIERNGLSRESLDENLIILFDVTCVKSYVGEYAREV
jgi:hypothetical protein